MARDFLTYYLPADIVELLDIDTLELSKDSFVDKELSEYFSDLLYKVELRDGRAIYVYVLLEHKSYPEPLIAFDLLRYMVEIWNLLLKQAKAGKKLPMIIPVVLYHGRPRWHIAQDFRSLIADDGKLERYLPDFHYELCDLSDFEDEEIKGAVVLRVAMLVFKYIFRDELSDRLPAILGLLRELTDKRSGLEYLETVLRYLSSGTDKVDKDDLRQAAEAALPEIGGKVMSTIAETWVEEGMQKGLQKGLQQGMQQGMQQGIIQKAQEDAIDILEARFNVVPRSIVEMINGIDDRSVLKILHKQAVIVGSLEEFKHVLEKAMS
ncbi:MAG: Rpn family recombination-promoting nuclease/putative transposase [Desulfobacterales bacterium]|nr:Rpn family recombination-promoting nuclease/putative transposase [Desulfobacterales bacterium]